MSRAAQIARMEAAASGEYRYMDNATFDLRTAALEWLNASEVLNSCAESEFSRASRKEWDAKADLFRAFEEAGIDRDLLKRLGVFL